MLFVLILVRRHKMLTFCNYLQGNFKVLFQPPLWNNEGFVLSDISLDEHFVAVKIKENASKIMYAVPNK